MYTATSVQNGQKKNLPNILLIIVFTNGGFFSAKERERERERESGGG
jgi:hypothetical protein